MLINASEGGDPAIVELGALLHDMADHKLWGGDVESGVREIEAWLKADGLPESIVVPVVAIARCVSFKGAGVADEPLSLEGQIVRDADRLDAIGAIGVARTFAYGGSKGRLLFDPGVPPEIHNSFDAYKQSTAPTINHFYEKLLLLKDRMHTKAAKQLAEERHDFMVHFLKVFFSEWGIDPLDPSAFGTP